MKRGIPSLNWLRVFEAAARLENFARAAEFLHMSTSAVSQQIKALESHLGEELFNRGPRHVELTDAGHAFLPTVRQSLASIEETTASLFGQNKDNTLTLQADLNLALSWLTAQFLTSSPGSSETRFGSIGIKVRSVPQDWACFRSS